MEYGRHRERVISWAGALSIPILDATAMAVHDAREPFQIDKAGSDATIHRRLSRQSRARHAVLRYLAVWSWVAAMALIAQAFAPS
jgi:hypothetical protein